MFVVREELGEAGAYEALAPSSATGITAGLVKPTTGTWKDRIAKGALITVETAPIRFRIDSGAATTSNGHRMDPGQSYVIQGGVNVKNFSCIDISAASSVKVTVFY